MIELDMEAGDPNEVAVISEVDISEEMPNGVGDDSAFAEPDSGEEPTTHTVVQDATGRHGIPTSISDQVFVHTQGFVTAEQLREAGIKTTHIVIQDHSLHVQNDDDRDSVIELKSSHDHEHDDHDDDHSPPQIVHHHHHHQDDTDVDGNPYPPPTPSTPCGKAKGFKYQWDPSAHLPILPVRCKSSNGELHKSRFGSGECKLHA